MSAEPVAPPRSRKRREQLQKGDKAAERKLLDELLARMNAGEIRMFEARRLFREGTEK